MVVLPLLAGYLLGLSAIRPNLKFFLHFSLVTARKIATNYHYERAMGIGPTYQAWEARILPLNYARVTNCQH